ncbi:MAG: LPS assembly protein LptD [Acidobacteriota bacterium]
MRFRDLLILSALILGPSLAGYPQRTNPVEREVSNPITDTPNINPISPEQSATPKPGKKPSFAPEGGDGEVVVYSDHQSVQGEPGKRIVIHEGNVDVRFGIYRLQANKITIYEAENKMIAEGSVVFDQGDDQRITGAKGIWNYKTKLGTFEDSTGFTNQTNDGTIIYFTAEKVERVSADEIVITKGVFTACEEAVPKWSFTADQARIKTNDRLKLKNARFRLKNIPLIPLPYASIPIKKRDRASGFLTPTFGYSAAKGARLSGAYYQTLGRSADATVRFDIYTARGIGYGLDLRTRANSRSYFDMGFYAVQDRIFGHKVDAEHPDQGGSIVYANGVHYFSNGFTAAADVRLTSNLAFRQVFSDGIQQIISPIEVSQAFVNKSWDNYTLNLLARSQVISIPNVRVKTRDLPSINFDKRPSKLSFLKPLYFEFKTSFDGVSRREDVDDIGLYRAQTGGDPIVTPALGQRFDIYPEFMLPISTKYVNFTATGAGRVTYYSDSLNSIRTVVGKDLIRKYGEFQFDIRPVALARNYYGKNDKFMFRHVIEPYITYHYIKGINNFSNIIRYDYTDTATDTNEVEFGLTNRIYTRRYAEAVTEDAQRRLAEQNAARRRNTRGGLGQSGTLDSAMEDASAKASPDPTGSTDLLGKSTEKNPLSIQPYEIFSLTVRGKYFFDKTFGGALVPGQRNEIEPITALTFYTFGGVQRGFSPINIDATYRPQRTIFVNTRMDIDTQTGVVRDVSAAIGYDKKLVKIFQTFYYTRAITLMPSLVQYADPSGKEAGTLRGSQWSPSIFIGNRDHGWFGGTSLFYDFENRRTGGLSPLISSLYTVGYTYDCCSLALQYYTFNVGVRNENRYVLSFRLNGIGTFGTEQYGQGLNR